MTHAVSIGLPHLQAGQFTMSPADSAVSFSTKNFAGMKVTGRFDEFRSEVRVGASLADSTITVTVDLNSVDTKSRMRDRDLQKKKIFDTGAWPAMRFSSTDITEDGDAVTIVGDLTVRDQTRPVTLLGRYTGSTPNGGHTFEVSGEVNPREFGITHPMIRKPVTLQVNAELVPTQV